MIQSIYGTANIPQRNLCKQDKCGSTFAMPRFDDQKWLRCHKGKSYGICSVAAGINGLCTVYKNITWVLLTNAGFDHKDHENSSNWIKFFTGGKHVNWTNESLLSIHDWFLKGLMQNAISFRVNILSAIRRNRCKHLQITRYLLRNHGSLQTQQNNQWDTLRCNVTSARG